MDNDEPQPPPRPVLPILSGVSNVGDMVVFEEPRKYHPVPHRTVVRGACSLDLGAGAGSHPNRDPDGTKNNDSNNNNSITNNAANGSIACSYRAISSGGGQTQVVVTDESSSLRRKLYFTVERGTTLPL